MTNYPYMAECHGEQVEVRGPARTQGHLYFRHPDGSPGTAPRDEVVKPVALADLSEAQRKMLLDAAARPLLNHRGAENHYSFVGRGQASTAKSLETLGLGGYVMDGGTASEPARFWIHTRGYEVAAEAGVRPKGEEGRKEMVARLTSINPMGNYGRLTDDQLRETLARHEESPHSKALRRGAMSR